MQKHIAIIGGGPGGYVAAIRASQLDAKVTLIEAQKLGGTCLNDGCIPTKALYQSASYFKLASSLHEFGVNVDNITMDVETIQRRKEGVVDSLVGGIDQILNKYHVEIIYGTAAFIDEKSLLVTPNEGEKLTLSPDAIIIATGSETAIPPIDGVQLPGVTTSKDLMKFEKVPASLTIIGGGVIGMEFAGIFSALGTEVTVVEFMDQILGNLDSELVKRYQVGLKKQGITVHKNTRATRITEDENGNICHLEGKKGEFAVKSEQILLAVGRKPRIGGLNLEQADIKYTLKGIEVNEHFVTNKPHIYAIGDVNGINMLAHVASHQAIVAVENIMKLKSSDKSDVVPACVFVFPEIATVGETEDSLKAKDVDYKKSKFMLGANGKALALGEPDGFIKVLSDQDNRILGVHIMGAHASDLIHEATLAIHHNMNVEAIAEMIHAHPTLSEAFHEAVLGLKGEAIHMAPTKK